MTFTHDPEGVDPALVPQVVLRDGTMLPGIGLGTFGSDRYTPSEVAGAVAGALRAGYRFVDCASVYGNEQLVGEVLADALAGGLPREDIFVMSKVWNDRHAPTEVAASCRASLRDLRIDHLDGYLVHWPFPNYHRPFAHERLIKGQVFLWPGAGSWLDLWDVDGTIPGWDGYAVP